MRDAANQDEYGVSVDTNVCVGHGRCYELAPDVFDEDEAGYCVVKSERIPKTLLNQAQSGEANCPECAIRITPLQA